jgi:hypothetical protein
MKAPSTAAKVVTVVAALVLFSFIGYATVGLVTTVPASGDITSQANSGLEVTFEGVSEYPEEPFVDDQTVQAQNGTIESAGSSKLSLPGGLETAGDLSVTVEQAPSQVTIRTTDKRDTSFQGNLNSLELTGITVDDDQADLTFDAGSSGTPTITVDNLPDGDGLVMRDVNTGELVGFAVRNPDGSTTFEQLEPGSHTVSIEPLVIEVRDVETGELIDNVTAEIRLFRAGTDEVFVRTSKNGTFTTGTLPPGEPFAITAEAPGFIERQTFIENTRQQETLFLLNDSTSNQLVRFNVEDRTGDFQSNVRIQIERAVNTTDSAAGVEEYQIVAGDIVGSQLEFETTLEPGTRYRISVANGRGDVRQLGTFNVKTDKVIDLVISGIDVGFTVPEDTTQVNATQAVNETSGNKTLRVLVQDPSQETTDVTIEVVPFSDESTVLDSTTTQGPIGNFSFQTKITGDQADKRLLARVTYERQGETVTKVVPFGSDTFVLLPGLASEWGQIFGVGFLLVLGGVFSVGNAKIGAVLIPGVALILTIGGVLNTVVAPAAVGLAFAVAVGINIVSSTEGIFR